VPRDAVYEGSDGEVVYVQQRGEFIPRRVETGDRNDEAVVAVSGLKEGERVALTDPTRMEAE